LRTGIVVWLRDDSAQPQLPAVVRSVPPVRVSS